MACIYRERHMRMYTHAGGCTRRRVSVPLICTPIMTLTVTLRRVREAARLCTQLRLQDALHEEATPPLHMYIVHIYVCVCLSVCTYISIRSYLCRCASASFGQKLVRWPASVTQPSPCAGSRGWHTCIYGERNIRTSDTAPVILSV